MSKPRSFVLLTALAAFIVAVPALAEAQRGRGGRGPVVRSVVVVGPYAYPRYYYDPWYQWGPYPYPYPPYGYRYMYDDMAASVRLQVAPREAQVFVDGYLAGVVDDFDGVFQRLRLRPGGHEITVYLDGYQTARESVYLSAGVDRKLQFTLNRLRDGERSEPPPPPNEDADAQPADEPMPTTRRMGPPPRERDAPPATRETVGRFGTLSLRVQPTNAEIVIDGERWATTGGDDRITIQLAEGRHRVEVRREGMTSYTEEILIRRGATFTLNVSLK